MHSSKPAGPDLARRHAESETSHSNNFNLCSHFHPSLLIKTSASNYHQSERSCGVTMERNQIVMKFYEIIKGGEFWRTATGLNKLRKPLKMSPLSGRVCSHARGIPWSCNWANKQEMQYISCQTDTDTYTMRVRWFMRGWTLRWSQFIYSSTVTVGKLQIGLEWSEFWGDQCQYASTTFNTWAYWMWKGE